MQPDNRQEIPVREDVNCPPSLPDVEAVAKRIYEAMRVAAHAHDPERTTPEWVDRGNSLMQEEARRVALFIASAQPASTALVEALEPFSKAAGELYARNWNASQVVMSFSAEEGIVKLTAGDFFAARSALSASRSTSREGSP